MVRLTHAEHTGGRRLASAPLAAAGARGVYRPHRLLSNVQSFFPAPAQVSSGPFSLRPMGSFHCR